MLEEIINALDKDDALPIGHKFAKLMLATIAGFVAQELAKKAYMAVLIASQKRQS
jgi:hypothetical protein